MMKIITKIKNIQNKILIFLISKYKFINNFIKKCYT